MKTITELAQSFDCTGFEDHVISDQELKTWRDLLLEIADYMRYRGDSTMRTSILAEAESVDRMIEARKG